MALKARAMSSGGSSSSPSTLVCTPAVAHFGGFVLHRTHRMVLRVLNASGRSQRLQMTPPTTPFFRAKWKGQRRQTVAPGMVAEIEVEFCPTKFRYHYDCVRITCEDGALALPLHGYPVVNAVDFPRLIDFGKCVLGSVSNRVAQIKCSTPIKFPFQLVVTDAHPDLILSPLKGVIPANGFVVRVTYLLLLFFLIQLYD